MRITARKGISYSDFKKSVKNQFSKYNKDVAEKMIKEQYEAATGKKVKDVKKSSSGSKED